MNDERNASMCERTVDEMADVLDGSADAELLAHVADCDTCRDARYDAEHAELLMSEAGRDFRLPVAFAEKLRAAPVAPAPEAKTPSISAPAPVSANPTANRKLPTANSLQAFAKRWTVPFLAAAAAAAIFLGRAH